MYIAQYARMTSCFSLGLRLAVSIFQFWIVYHTVAQERDSGSRCRYGYQWIYSSFGMYIVQYARRTSCFSLGLGLAVNIFHFWIGYHTVAQ